MFSRAKAGWHLEQVQRTDLQWDENENYMDGQ